MMHLVHESFYLGYLLGLGTLPALRALVKYVVRRRLQSTFLGNLPERNPHIGLPVGAHHDSFTGHVTEKEYVTR